MNRMVLLFALLLTSGIAPAQEAAPAAATAVVPAPRLVCDAPEFDYGTVDNSQTVEHTFLLRNEGDLTLEIKQVRPSCGCTVASISERNVPPGGETRIGSRLSLAGRTGPQHKIMTVESNDPERPQFILTLKGVAGTALSVQPTRLIHSQLAAGSQPTGTVVVSTTTETAFRITAVESTSDRVQATVETVEEGRSYRLLVSPTQPLGPGQLETTLILRTDHPQRPTVDVQVLYHVNADLVVAPRELVFPAPSETPVTRYIIVRSQAGAHPFTLRHVETPDPSIKTEITPFGNNGYRIQLAQLRPLMNLHQRVIRIHTDIPGQAPLDVPLRIVDPAAP